MPPATSPADLLEQAGQTIGAGRPLAAVGLWRDALNLPGLAGEAWRGAAQRAVAIGDTFAAAALARRFHLETPDQPGSAFFAASILTDCGFADEAVALLRPHAEAGALSNNDIFKFTRMLSFAGAIDEANARARALLSHNPSSPTLWERIAETKRFRAGDQDIAAMERLLAATPPANAKSIAAIARALAKAYVELGDDSAAARCLALRAEAARTLVPFDPAPYDAAAQDIVRWCASAPGERAVGAPGSNRAIFILGPPRSGTTLVEQILSRHSHVEVGGERRHFLLAAHMFGDFSARSVDAALTQGGDALWREIGGSYLALSQELLGAGAFTDKLLSNHYRVRAILNALPDAKIVHVRRNALDLAWSCWRAHFDAQSPWANSEEGVALYIRTYRDIVAAWSARYPGRIVELRYEDLIRAPDAEIPRLLAACGLPDEAATRAPQESRRAVNTLSFAEVRGPIDATRADATRDFPVATQRLREALAREGVAD